MSDPKPQELAPVEQIQTWLDSLPPEERLRALAIVETRLRLRRMDQLDLESLAAIQEWRLQQQMK